MDLALNNLQRLICHKIKKPTQTKNVQVQDLPTVFFVEITVSPTNQKAFLFYFIDSFFTPAFADSFSQESD